MAMAGVDSSNLQAKSKPMSVGYVWRLEAGHLVEITIRYDTLYLHAPKSWRTAYSLIWRMELKRVTK